MTTTLQFPNRWTRETTYHRVTVRKSALGFRVGDLIETGGREDGRFLLVRVLTPAEAAHIPGLIADGVLREVVE